MEFILCVVLFDASDEDVGALLGPAALPEFEPPSDVVVPPLVAVFVVL